MAHRLGLDIPVPIQLIHTSQNSGSLAALLAVLEAELAPGSHQPVLLRHPAAFDGRGLLVQSFMTARAAQVAAEMAELRRRFGDSLLAIAGGPHPSGRPEETLTMGFRWVVVGEAGPPLGELVRALAAGRPPRPGILPRARRRPLDDYPPWPSGGQLFAPIEITRGCPIGCTFCQTPALHGRRPRHRSLESLQRAFRHAVATGHTFTRFVAPNAFAYGSRDGRLGDWRALERLLVSARRCGMQRLYLGSFPSEVRPESVTPALLQLLRDHCDNRGVVVGVQSGSPSTLRRLRRGHTVEEALRAVALIAAAGLEPRVDFIFGLPDESEADRAATRELMRRLVESYGARINTHVFTPLPGTPLEGREPAPVDEPTRELLEQIIGRGRANHPLRDFGCGSICGRGDRAGGELLTQPRRPAASGGSEQPGGFVRPGSPGSGA